jgi:hypothetical protein
MHDFSPIVLKDKSAPACALLLAVVAEFGVDCFAWDPHILRIELLEEYNITLSEEQSDKLQAAITILNTDAFETDWHAFNNCIHALNGEPFDYDTLEPIDAEQIAAAMPEIEVLRSKFLEEGLQFTDEIKAYAGMIFSEYGLFFAPNEFPSAIMPSLPGEHNSDSQIEKQEALAEVYNKKKEKINEYLAKFQ